MHPAFSVIFLTTLIGAGQGLFLALLVGQIFGLATAQPLSHEFFVVGSGISLVLLGLGLFASFFHLGHPERAWRAAARWRTSWLSREVIALPTFMAAVFAYGAAHYLGWSDAQTLGVGLVGTIVDFTLFVCTAMIYACIKFLREWNTPLTIVNFIFLGTASGFLLATAYATFSAPHLIELYGVIGLALTVAGLVTRSWSLIRNAGLKPKSTLQTAIGVHHTKVTQRSMGHMGGSYNTREFVHGKTATFVTQMKNIFIVLTFVVPPALLGAAMASGIATLIPLAFAVQYIGLIAERWFFFAQVNHPQNLYYQTVS